MFGCKRSENIACLIGAYTYVVKISQNFEFLCKFFLAEILLLTYDAQWDNFAGKLPLSLPMDCDMNSPMASLADLALLDLKAATNDLGL